MKTAIRSAKASRPHNQVHQSTDVEKQNSSAGTPAVFHSMRREIEKIADPVSWDHLRAFYGLA